MPYYSQQVLTKPAYKPLCSQTITLYVTFAINQTNIRGPFSELNRALCYSGPPTSNPQELFLEALS